MRIAVRWVAAILVMLAIADSAAAAGLDFTPARKVFRVCNLLVPPGNANHNPYLFIALRRCALKPAGWEFENPLARRFVTGEMMAAWEDPAHAYVAAPTDTTPPPPYEAPDLRMSSRAGYWADHTGLAAGDPALLGRPISKEWPQYWEVYLTPETAPRLKEFDLIYVSGRTGDGSWSGEGRSDGGGAVRSNALGRQWGCRGQFLRHDGGCHVDAAPVHRDTCFAAFHLRARRRRRHLLP